MENIKIKGLEDGDLFKYSIGYLSKIEAGIISATKQWETDRDSQLEKSTKGGKTAAIQKKGVHSLSTNELSENGKNGYKNGLGKLSKKKIKKLASTAGLVNRDKNAKLKPDDVIFMRNNFIPRHSEFGIVAFSKKYGVSESQIRNAVKGRSFKNIK